jgi:dihydropteroate synthase
MMQPTQAGPLRLEWGRRTYVMAIVNVTPDSFSGDGLAGDDAVERAVAQARRAAEEGADLVDVGGESTRPGHTFVDADEEARRVVPVVAAIHAALPDLAISIDTTKAAVAEASLDAGACLVNDIWGIAAEAALLEMVAARAVPLVVMHNRAEPSYVNLMAEVIADLQNGLERAVAAGIGWERLIVDPGFGFGKTPAHNLALMHDLAALRVLNRPILLGTSRKSTLGKVLDLGPDQRVEATIATTALGIAAGVDMVRVHDVEANVRAARMTDAIVRRGGAG